jgi:hypothetical protein
MCGYLLKISLLAFLIGARADAVELVYEGPWRTTNRSLDGVMTCVVTPLAKHGWQGRFHGVWQGVPFDYTVTFTGPPGDLRGTATIDGAPYEWRGWINRRRMRANFSGARYSGAFDLIRRQINTAARGTPPAGSNRR